MKKALWMTCAYLALTASAAAATGGSINLGWGDCGGLPATENRTFACDTNAGTNTLVGSFLAPCCVTELQTIEVAMDLQSTGATLPNWWQMRTAQCRAQALVPGFDFTSGPFTCFDYWQNRASGGVQEDPFAGNRARIRMLMALPYQDPTVGPVPEALETYSYKCIISNRKTAGQGACGGCGTGVCIVLNSITLDQKTWNPYGDYLITAPANRNWVTWQGGTGADCFLATPARNVTWGSIKTLYK
jgi:hypothetical protein